MLPPKAYRFLFLNAVRALSLIFLILVFSSNIVTMSSDINAVKGANSFVATNSTSEHDMEDCDYIDGSTVPNQAGGVFWAVLNRLFIIIQCVILFASEIGWPEVFFARFFPVLGNDFGVGATGVIECLLGAAVLSHHVDTFAMVSAFLIFSIGILNIILALIFGGKVKAYRCILSWRNKAPELPRSVSGVASAASSVFSEKGRAASPDSHDSNMSFAGYGFGRQAEKKGLKEFIISKPVEALPRYVVSRGQGAMGNKI
jgi:hypothetical protein